MGHYNIKTKNLLSVFFYKFSMYSIAVLKSSIGSRISQRNRILIK